jgi:hypothetical protein
VSLDKVVWCERGFLPTFYGFCPSEKAWRRDMKKRGLDEPYPTTDARCTTFVQKSSGKTSVLVTVGEHIDDKDDPVGVVGLIVHEAVHVWQSVKEDIGESSPSKEFEAYALQHIVQQLFGAYAKTRGAKVDV